MEGTKMTGLEEKIWAAAFAHAFFQEKRILNSFMKELKVRGFTCAEMADEAVEAFREAINGDDAQYLLPIQEK